MSDPQEVPAVAAPVDPQGLQSTAQPTPLNQLFASSNQIMFGMAPALPEVTNHNESTHPTLQNEHHIINEIKKVEDQQQMQKTFLQEAEEATVDPLGSSVVAPIASNPAQPFMVNPMAPSPGDQKVQTPGIMQALTQPQNPAAALQLAPTMIGPSFPLIFQDGRVMMSPQMALQPNFLSQLMFPTAPQLNQTPVENKVETPLPSPHSLFHRDGSRRARGGVIEPFPEKLHRLLREVDAAGRSDVISFISNGRAFRIHKQDQFFNDIVPLYFRQSRLSSFKRQLNLYGFELINTGPAQGGYYNENFLEDSPELCRRIKRVPIKTTKQAEESVQQPSEDKGNSNMSESLVNE